MSKATFHPHLQGLPCDHGMRKRFDSAASAGTFPLTAKRVGVFSELSIESALGRMGAKRTGDVTVEYGGQGDSFGCDKDKKSRIDLLAEKVCFLMGDPFSLKDRRREQNGKRNLEYI